MARITWSLLDEKPRIQIELWLADGVSTIVRDLLADTGAGRATEKFEFLLHEDDCLFCGASPVKSVMLEGAYTGSYPLFIVRISIPTLHFDDQVSVVGVQDLPLGFDGIACFPFLNRFNYGNFGLPYQFGLER